MASHGARIALNRRPSLHGSAWGAGIYGLRGLALHLLRRSVIHCKAGMSDGMCRAMLSGMVYALRRMAHLSPTPHANSSGERYHTNGGLARAAIRLAQLWLGFEELAGFRIVAGRPSKAPFFWVAASDCFIQPYSGIERPCGIGHLGRTRALHRAHCSHPLPTAGNPLRRGGGGHRMYQWHNNFRAPNVPSQLTPLLA